MIYLIYLGSVLFLAAGLLWFFPFTVIRVKGRSMLPTLKNGDLLIVRRFPGRKPLQRGTIVICHYPGRTLPGMKSVRLCFVKRVVGLPGERLAIDQGVVSINGERLDEPYLSPDYAHGRGTTRERRIGRHRYFLMGDHRDNSNDSRSVGTIHHAHVIARVIHVIHVPKKWSDGMEKLDRKMDALMRKQRRAKERGRKKP